MTEPIEKIPIQNSLEILKAIPDPFFIVNSKSHVLYHHIPSNFHSPYPLEVLLNAKRNVEFDFSVLKKVIKGIRYVKTTHSSKRVDISFKKDDYTYHYSFHYSDLPEDKVLCIVRDISQRSNFLIELSHSHSELEFLVNEKTKQLQTALDIATKANFAKTNFLANVTHELRTPIHAILSFSDIGKEKVVQGKDLTRIIEYFELIYKSGTRLLNFLNNTIEYSNLESDRVTFHFEECHFSQLFELVKLELKPNLDKKNLNLELVDQTTEDLTICDTAKIIQVLRHIVKNAITFSPPDGSIRIQVSEEPFLHPKTQKKVRGTRVCVRDQGPGIPTSDLDKIFDSFSQSSSTHAGTVGAGLGLSICKFIIQGHNGKIFAENTQPGGAMISFILPKKDIHP